ncbi:MAG: hypothetical protein Q9187_009618, partial [Circinaria calcarea]
PCGVRHYTRSPSKVFVSNNFLSFMPSTRKQLQRKRLAERIDTFGTNMAPCSHCRRANIENRCKVSRDSDYCGPCVASGAKNCDVLGPTDAEWNRIEAQRLKLDKEIQTVEEEREREEAASEGALKALEAALKRRSERMSELSSRRRRLLKQQKLLREKEGKMIQHGFSSIEELERLEEQERITELLSSSSPGFFFSGFDPSSPLSLEPRGSDGETLQPSPNNV